MGFPLLSQAAPGERERDPPAGPAYVAANATQGVDHIDGITTCFDLWERSCKRNADLPALAWREPALGGNGYGPYQYMSYKEAHELASQAGAGLASLGLSKGDRVGICAVNSPEWMLAMQGINRMGYVAVPLYDTFGEDAVAYVARHAEVRAVLCGAAKLRVVSGVAARLAGEAARGATNGTSEAVEGGASAESHRVEAVIYWGDADEASLKALQAAVPKVLTWRGLLGAGADAPCAPQAPAPEDLCTIMYTSGTTGNPKGVMLTHAAVATEVAAVQQCLVGYAGHQLAHDASRRYFSFLTLAHIFDRVVEEFVLLLGGCIGYYTGDPRRIMDDAAEFKPTVFAGVPRVLERIHTTALAKVAKLPLLQRLAFSLALSWKGAWVRAGWKPEEASPLADAVVFNKTKAALGGGCRVILSGGAPLAPAVHEFLQLAMGCPLLQGYGLTETCAASFLTVPWVSRQIGTVGPPVPGLQVRLEAVPELGYSPYGQPARGEVCLKGPALFKGYYKQPDTTAECFDADGWFHTGDVGEIVSDGVLRIVDRKKNIFKLSQGEYIAVEKVEEALGLCSLVEQIWIYGNSFHHSLVAVAVPHKRPLLEWAKGAGLEGADLAAICKSAEARAHVLAQVVAAGRAAKLKGFELPAAIHLEPEPFSVDNGLMTPKLSLKRPQLQKRYQKQIDEMYASLAQKA